jgi:hypothetical protein
MSDIKARLTGGDPDGETLGVRLDDGDLYPYHVKQGGELPTEIDGRKVSKEFRDGLLAQEGKWTRVKRDTAPKTASTTTTAKDAGKDGEK